MKKLVSRRASPATVIAMLALFVALGTNAYASAIFGEVISGAGPYGQRFANASAQPGHAGVIGDMTASNPGATSAGLKGVNRGTNDSYGVWGQHLGAGAGVFGSSSSSRGAGVRGSNSAGVGVFGQHTATSGNEPGVRGTTSSTAERAAGVVGIASPGSAGRDSAGVYGQNNGTGGYGIGVWGSHLGAGPGIRGTSANGFGGEFTSSNYRGAYIRGGPSWIAAYLDGWTYVNGNFDVTANAWITGDLSVGGTCTGCTAAYSAQNAGSTAIVEGDLVAAAGVKVEAAGNAPVLLVRRAGAAGDAVIGVASTALTPSTAAEPDGVARAALVPVKGEAAPNGYVRVVTSGLARIRVDTSAVRIGERLTAGGADGRATRGTTGESLARVVSAPEGGFVWALIDAN